MLLGLFPALLIGLAQLAGGALLLARWPAPAPGERLVLAWALGGGLLGSLTLLIGLWRFDRWSLLALAAGLLLAGGRPLASLLRGLLPAAGREARRLWAGWPGRVLLAALLAFAGLDLLGAGFVVLDGDALRYHLAVPHHWLTEGRIAPAPGIPFSNFPLLIQLTYAHGLVWHAAAPAMQHLSWALMLALGVYCWTRRAGSEPAVAALAALLLLSLTDVSAEAPLPRVDLALGLFGWGAAVCWARWRDDPAGDASRCWLLAGAALAGCAAAGKYTGLAVVAATGALLAWDWLRRRIGLAPLFWFGGLVALIAGPWYLKSWLWTGNPVFPFGGALFGGNLPPAVLAQIAAENSSYAPVARTPLNFVASPLLLTFDQSLFASGRIGPLWLALAPLLLLRFRRVAAGPLLAWSLIFAACWFWTSPLVRFAVPLLALAAPPLAGTLVALLRGEDPLDGARRSAAWRLLAGASLAAWLAFALASNFKNTRSRWAAALGLEPPEAILAARLIDGPYSWQDIERAEDAAEPLVVFGSAGLYIDRPVLLAGDLGAQPYADLERRFAGPACGAVAVLLPDQPAGPIDALAAPEVRRWLGDQAAATIYRRGGVALYRADGCR